MDLFVMIISVGLSTRFKQINKDLMRNKGEVTKSATKTHLYIRLIFKYMFFALAHVKRVLDYSPNAISSAEFAVPLSRQSDFKNNHSFVPE